MNLTLDIISGNGESLGPARRKVFGPEGGRIGRAPECDWVLANPYVSRHHATIRWISGTYYIESAGENGVALGTPQGLIPKLERRPLKHGDHLFIDEYEIAVGLDGVAADVTPAPSTAASGRPFVPAEDPFDLAAKPASQVVADPLGPSSDELDPLKHFGGQGDSGALSAPPQAPSWNHTPGISDQFAPPAAAPAQRPGQVIPDDWNMTSFGRGNAPQAPQPRRAPSPSPPATPASAATIPDDWDKTGFARKPTPGAPPPPPVRRPAAPDPAPAARGAPPAGPGPASAPRSPGVPPGEHAPPTGVTPKVLDVAALLSAAGVDPASLPADTARALGSILRSVVQGVIDVLRARAQIKEQFRLTQTIVKTAENNPLKFAVNAEDALNSLLGKRNPAYLPPLEAFEDAFDDIRFHQLAMLAGMQAGFDQMMRRFDPQQLQERFEKRARRGGLLSMSAKSRYWEQFTEEFQELAGDRDRAFQRLFAEEFALAYEKQLEQLKRTHSKPRR